MAMKISELNENLNFPNPKRWNSAFLDSDSKMLYKIMIPTLRELTVAGVVIIDLLNIE